MGGVGGRGKRPGGAPEVEEVVTTVSGWRRGREKEREKKANLQAGGGARFQLTPLSPSSPLLLTWGLLALEEGESGGEEGEEVFIGRRRNSRMMRRWRLLDH